MAQQVKDLALLALSLQRLGLFFFFFLPHLLHVEVPCAKDQTCVTAAVVTMLDP